MAHAASSSSPALGHHQPRALIRQRSQRSQTTHLARVAPRRVTTPTITELHHRHHRQRRNVVMAASEVDDDEVELPDYDVMPLGPLESSAISLGVSGWQGGSDDANAYVLAIDRGYVLIGAQSPSEVAIMKDYQKYWATSEAAELPGVRAPIVYATVEVGGDGGGTTVLDVLQAHSIATGGAEPDLFCFKMAGSASGSAAAEQQKAIADGVKAAWELGVCPGTIAVDGYDGESIEALVSALSDAPDIKVAFNRIELSLANRAPLQDGTVDACKRLGVAGSPRPRPSPGPLTPPESFKAAAAAAAAAFARLFQRCLSPPTVVV